MGNIASRGPGALSSEFVTKLLGEIEHSKWGSWAVGRAGIYFVQRSPTSIAHLRFCARNPTTVYEPPKQIPYFGRALSLSACGDALLSTIDHSDDEVTGHGAAIRPLDHVAVGRITELDVVPAHFPKNLSGTLARQ